MVCYEGSEYEHALPAVIARLALVPEVVTVASTRWRNFFHVTRECFGALCEGRVVR